MPFFNGATRADIPSGTLMLFQQTAAPTGWVKQATHNDKALRVVSGTAGSGGSAAFTTALATPELSLSPSLGATTLTAAQMPSHTHSFTASNSDNKNVSALGTYDFPTSTNSGTFGASTGGAGSNNSHTHSFSISGSATINVAYVDVIIASKS